MVEHPWAQSLVQEKKKKWRREEALEEEADNLPSVIHSLWLELGMGTGKAVGKEAGKRNPSASL